MIWEKKCTTIVMLTHLKEGGKVSTSVIRNITCHLLCNVTGEVSSVLAITWTGCLW